MAHSLSTQLAQVDRRPIKSPLGGARQGGGAAGATDRTTRYGYDDLGRLTTATDGTTLDANGMPTGATCTRTYAFDANSNRTALTQAPTAGAPAGTCPTSVPATDSYGYDTADRLQPTAAGTPRASLRYDALGRTRTLPAADTADGSADVTIDYYVDDLVKNLTQGTKTSTFALDAAARRAVRTDTGAANPAVSYYSGDDDSPDVVKETDNSYTRNIASFSGMDAIVTRAGTAGAAVTLQLANLHGDISATVAVTASSAADLKVTETTEYGETRTQPAAGSTSARYGWLGTHQRDSSTPGGLILMGVRLYSAGLGRFLSVDPILGGNADDYVYPSDPVNELDLDGKKSWWAKQWSKAKRNYKKVALVGARVLSTASTLVSLCPLPQCTMASAAMGVAAAGAYLVAGQKETALKQLGATAASLIVGRLRIFKIRTVGKRAAAPKRTQFTYQEVAGVRSLALSATSGKAFCGTYYPVYCG